MTGGSEYDDEMVRIARRYMSAAAMTVDEEDARESWRDLGLGVDQSRDRIEAFLAYATDDVAIAIIRGKMGDRGMARLARAVFEEDGRVDELRDIIKLIVDDTTGQGPVPP